MKSPCLNCKKRVLGCHSHCGDYATFKAQLEKEKQAKILEIKQTEITIARIKRTKRSK